MWTSKTYKDTKIYGEILHMTSFSTLKKSSNQIDRLNKEIDKLKTPTYDKKEDDRFWKPEIDKAGNGSAIIRFLPAPAVDGDEALPWVRIFNHSFKGPGGKWYIENSLTTPTDAHPAGQKDPVSELNSKLWGMSEDDNSATRKQARAQKRKLSYYSNIYVVSDPKRPEREGKVFLYRYGKKIFDKILLSMNPEFEGDAQVNPFDLWTGANFRLRIRSVEGYPNYEQSTFAASEPLLADDAALEAIWKSEYSLKELVTPDKFKSYDELKRKLNEVLGNTVDLGVSNVETKPVVKPSPVQEKVAEIKRQLDDDNDDDEFAQFKALAE